MKLVISWLKDYVDIDDKSPEEISEALLKVGFEVEEIIYAGSDVSGVVTGKVLTCEAHENSDHLHICTVDVGDKVLQIVCGAPNVTAGVVVPVALVGAKLGDFAIKDSKIRGVASSGMLCSGKELGVDDTVIAGSEVDGLLILPSDTPLGMDINKLLGNDEYILDVSVTANRPDCQSVLGMAREVSACFDKPLKMPNFNYSTCVSDIKIPSVNIEARDVCDMYCGRLIADIKVEQSPKWMRDRLRHMGFRAINNIVDITNYVLCEIGQPLHAFDLRVVSDKIVVRKSLKDEKITALNATTYALSEDMTVIANSEKALAIAGIMGGEESGVSCDTECVFLETARFERRNIRVSSKKLGLRSDSSSRYEKGVDYISVEYGRERALALFDELGAGKVTTLASDDCKPRPSEKVIKTTAEQICGIIGINITQADVTEILNKLQFKTECDGNTILCYVPLHRDDVEDFADLAEEVLRYYGYDKIVSTFVDKAKCTVGGMTEKQRVIENVKDLMCGYGYFEMQSYSFIPKASCDLLGLSADDSRRNVLELKNPLNEDLAVMRPSLMHNLLSCLSMNINRGNDIVKIFELGNVFINNGAELPDERSYLSIGTYGGDADFYVLKNIVSEVLAYLGVAYKIEYSSESFLHPGISANILVDGSVIGCFGEVHPTIMENYNIANKCYVAEIDLASLVGNTKSPVYKEISKFPAVKRDLALIADDSVCVGDMIATIKQSASKIIEDVVLFDIYKGKQIDEDKKSVALSLKFRSKDKTLSDDDLQPVIAKLLKKIKQEYGAELRK